MKLIHGTVTLTDANGNAFTIESDWSLTPHQRAFLDGKPPPKAPPLTGSLTLRGKRGGWRRWRVLRAPPTGRRLVLRRGAAATGRPRPRHLIAISFLTYTPERP